MTGKEIQTVIDFEASLTIGKQVRINWTTCHRQFTGLGTVKKINQKSILVTLSEDVSCQDLGSEPYPEGHTIKAPLIGDLRGWTCNNRVEPAGYEVVTQVLESAERLVEEKKADGWTKDDFASALGKMMDSP